MKTAKAEKAQKTHPSVQAFRDKLASIEGATLTAARNVNARIQAVGERCGILPSESPANADDTNDADEDETGAEDTPPSSNSIPITIEIAEPKP